MADPTAYEIVIRGRATARHLRPLLDDFAFDHSADGVTRLVGDITDASHLHGVLAHLRSVHTEIISIAPLVRPVSSAAEVRQTPPHGSPTAQPSTTPSTQEQP